MTELEDSDESVEALQDNVDQAAADYQTAAGKLSKLRQKLAKQLSANVSRQLKKLGLPNGEFRVEIEPRTQPHSAGLDVVEFQVQLNPGQAFGPLARVASGGELSRISLALQVVGEGRSNIPTFVFDEVDAGIGGGVAEIVGSQLRNLAGEHQVICVTHQAQVASQGQTHYRIAKLTDGKTSRTLITQLDATQRLEELSRMLGGVEITETTRAHAAEMLSRASSN